MGYNQSDGNPLTYIIGAARFLFRTIMITIEQRDEFSCTRGLGGKSGGAPAMGQLVVELNR